MSCVLGKQFPTNKNVCNHLGPHNILHLCFHHVFKSVGTSEEFICQNRFLCHVMICEPIWYTMQGLDSGNSRSMVCQTYGLHPRPSGLHENQDVNRIVRHLARNCLAPSSANPNSGSIRRAPKQTGFGPKTNDNRKQDSHI